LNELPYANDEILHSKGPNDQKRARRIESKNSI